MARVPSYPVLLERPFADAGNKRSIPDNTLDSGRASLTSGFPPETQLPLNLGGVAPNRLDFNGVLNMLSAFAFWQQSGGQWVYNESLSYTPPCMVFHKGILWWCLVENGPGSGTGVCEPGTVPACWDELLTSLASAGGSKTVLGTPVGSVLATFSATAPDGYFLCYGGTFDVVKFPLLAGVLGNNRIPDLRGYVVRGLDTTGSVDPDGANRYLGSGQTDAMQRMTGHIFVDNNGSECSGPFQAAGKEGGKSGSGTGNGHRINFDTARVVRCSAETRMKNIALNHIIKHD